MYQNPVSAPARRREMAKWPKKGGCATLGMVISLNRNCCPHMRIWQLSERVRFFFSGPIAPLCFPKMFFSLRSIEEFANSLCFPDSGRSSAVNRSFYVKLKLNGYS